MTAEADDALSDFRALYREHYGFVWHSLHRFGTTPALLDDAAQDVFVVAYRRRADFRGSSPRAWLYGIARRVASNYRRSLRRRVHREHSEPEAPMADGAREAIEALDRYLASLRPEDRELFILSEVEGMTGPEIAEVRGRNLRTIYTRIRKLRLDMHDRVGDPTRYRRARPVATERAWAVLVPLLHGASVVSKPLAMIKWVGLAAVASASVTAAVVIAAPSMGTSAADGQPDRARPLVAEPRQAARPDRAPAFEAGGVPSRPEASPATIPLGSSGLTGSSEKAGSGSVSPIRDSSRVSDTSSDLAAENDLLRRAASALRANDPAEALRTTDEHALRFPRGVLTDLRVALRIEALCAVGRDKQARTDAHAFLRERPGSPMATRIEKSCAEAQYDSQVTDKQGI